MTRNKRKMRKHELKKQAFLAGLTTMAVGAVALSSGHVQADEQVSSSNPSSDVSLVTGQEANQTISDVQVNSENQEQAQSTTTGSQAQNEKQGQAQATGEQVSQNSTDENQTSLESHEVSGTGVQAESETDPTQVTPIETEVNKEAGQENSTVKRASVVAVVERKTANTVSAARGDDYPAYLKNAAPDSVIDPWRLYNRECTSFTAWRLSSANGFTIPGAYGNGGQWGYRARREGYRVDNNPAIGSVGWLDDGSYGHVAWISNVMDDNVEIEEYNYGWNHSYHKRVAHKSAFTGYIHFKDLATAPAINRYNVEKLATQTGQSLSGGDYHIVLAADPSLGVDVAGLSTKNGTNIQLYKNTSDLNHVYTVVYLGNGYYKLVHKYSKKVLDVEAGSKSNGANVQLFDDNGSEAQQWIIKPVAGENTFEIVSRRSGLVLDVTGGNFVNNSNLQVYSYNNSKSQKFKFVATDMDAKKSIVEGDYHIVSALDTNLGLDVVGASNKSGANVQIYPNTSDKNQIFTVKYLNNGYYLIKAKSTGKVLDVYGDGNHNGDNIDIYDYNASDAQQWIIKPSNYNDFFEIVSKKKNKVIDVAGGLNKANTNVQLYVRNGSKSQAWKFVPVKKD